MVSVNLTSGQLKLLSCIFHDYKDIYRGSAEVISPVMELEKSLTEQTNGEYEPDTTYNLK